MPNLNFETKLALRKCYLEVWIDQNLWLDPSGPPSYFQFICNLRKMVLSPPGQAWNIDPDVAIEAQAQYGISTNSITGDFIEVLSTHWQFWINHICSDGQKTDANGVPIFEWVGYNAPASGITVDFNPQSDSYSFSQGAALHLLPNVAYLMGHFTVSLWSLYVTHYPHI
ncbi:MAG: hypothetical protein ACTSWW_02360 [Promethearchaeota archaeon]